MSVILIATEVSGLTLPTYPSAGANKKYVDANSNLGNISWETPTASSGMSIQGGGMVSGTLAFFIDDYISSSNVYNKYLQSGVTYGVLNATTINATYVSGTGIATEEFIYHIGDPDTYIQFQPDIVTTHVAGKDTLLIDANRVLIPNTTDDIDFLHHDASNTELFRSDAGSSTVGIGNVGANPPYLLTVKGAISAQTFSGNLLKTSIISCAIYRGPSVVDMSNLVASSEAIKRFADSSNIQTKFLLSGVTYNAISTQTLNATQLGANLDGNSFAINNLVAVSSTTLNSDTWRSATDAVNQYIAVGMTSNYDIYTNGVNALTIDDSAVHVNYAGDSVDFKVTDTDSASLLIADVDNGFVGINQETPVYELQVNGAVSANAFSGNVLKVATVSCSTFKGPSTGGVPGITAWYDFGAADHSLTGFGTNTFAISGDAAGLSLAVAGYDTISGAAIYARDEINSSGTKWYDTYQWMINSGSQYTNIYNSGQYYTKAWVSTQSLQDCAFLNETDIDALGTIGTGTWQGSAIDSNYLSLESGAKYHSAYLSANAQRELARQDADISTPRSGHVLMYHQDDA